MSREEFNLEKALLNVNRYLKQGFMEFIKNKKVTNMKQFDKYYKEYKELK